MSLDETWMCISFIVLQIMYEGMGEWKDSLQFFLCRSTAHHFDNTEYSHTCITGYFL